ncbi:LysR family transcriptional regulator [Paenibacillus sp. BK033]|uniref:LysR family transcriptional regulator n=1 Tax=unclassified Paenibacillus TaxID=185978 RepID=UPI001042C578|nr:LysR family transcriptional regulator [Paenibacillus sp. BK033]NIK69469.1 DNA-binding transcriptional LysR family regulator [Paenibacillus sp. BK720]TCM95647.1 DNA-binding transcriptional LysR family regulator [Paenibacillus sp. BK033]
MELTYLKTFCEVAKHGSFTRAAEILGYAQSSITTQIQRLEESYGAVLVERFGRSMRLTIAGEALLPYAKEVIRLHEESKEVVSKQSKGTLSIGTIETLAAYYLPPYLQAYRQQYPDISIMLQPGNEPVIIEAVKEGTLDVGVILDPPFSDPELHTQVLREEELVIIASPEHRFSALSEVRAEDLSGEPLILTEDGCTYRAMLLKVLRDGEIDSKPSYEFGNMEAIKQCVVYGLGVALLPRIAAAEEIRKQQLIALPFNHPDCRFYTQLIYSKKKWQSKAFLGFVDLMGGGNHRNH